MRNEDLFVQFPDMDVGTRRKFISVMAEQRTWYQQNSVQPERKAKKQAKNKFTKRIDSLDDDQKQKLIALLEKDLTNG